MQVVLNKLRSWANERQMQWSIAKSCGLDLHSLVTIMNEKLRYKQEDVYFGVNIGHNGVKVPKTIGRIKGALQMLVTFRNVTKQRKISVRQCKAFIITFVFSECD